MLGDDIFKKKPKNDESGSHVASGMEHSEQPVHAADWNRMLSAGPVNQSRTLQAERVDTFSSHSMARCYHIPWSGRTWEKSWSKKSSLVITLGLWKSLAGPLWDVDTGKGILERVVDMSWVTPMRCSVRRGSAHHVKPKEARPLKCVICVPWSLWDAVD